MTSKKILKQYVKLQAVLNMAYDRAAKGKGKERHANNQPFDEQVMARANRLTNGGFSFGQIMKKLEEIPNLKGKADKINEMLDIIVYAAGYVMIKLEEKDDVVNAPGLVDNSGSPSKEEGK
jgi:hypothetical protein